MEDVDEFKRLHVHHSKTGPCYNRKRYRDGKRKTAVKAFGIFDESTYLLIFNVPTIGVEAELEAKLSGFGELDGPLRWLHDYPLPIEEFTKVALVQFQKIASARLTKRKMDDQSFYGSCLHICYAPEFETVAECRLKLFNYRKFVNRRYRQHVEDSTERMMQDKTEDQTTLVLPDVRYPPPNYPTTSIVEEMVTSAPPNYPTTSIVEEMVTSAPPNYPTSSIVEEVIASAPPQPPTSSSGERDTIDILREAISIHTEVAFGATVSVRSLPQSVETPPRFLPRQLKRRADDKMTVGELKRQALILGAEQGAQVEEQLVDQLRQRSSLTGELKMETQRKDIRNRVKSVLLEAESKEK